MTYGSVSSVGGVQNNSETERINSSITHDYLSSLSNSSLYTGHRELDSHADTCALGSNFVPLHLTGRVCDVSPYKSDAYDAEKHIPIVTAATAYTDLIRCISW
jgi:hypothetical protein